MHRGFVYVVLRLLITKAGGGPLVHRRLIFLQTKQVCGLLGSRTIVTAMKISSKLEMAITGLTSSMT